MLRLTILRLTGAVLSLALLGCAGLTGKDEGEEDAPEEDTDCPDDEIQTYFADDDGDGYGTPDESRASCRAPDGYVDNRKDCDDEDAEVGDDLQWYADNDGDGYGDPETLEEDCDAPEGTVADGTDCDDGDPRMNPGEDEDCDGYDNDCDGLVDDDDDVAGSTWYADNDGDGYSGDDTVEACDRPDGYGTRADDCDDDDPRVNPGEDETCNDGLDNDCDGSASPCALADLTVGNADAELIGEDSADLFGWDIGIGDVNGDGRNDIVVSAYQEDGGGSSYLGGVYAFTSAPSGTVDASTAAKKWNGTVNYGYGNSVDVIGDYDGDGYDDILVGAPGASSTDGSAYLYAGASRLPTNSTWSMTGPTADCGCGQSITGGTDLDDDGLVDLAIGCQNLALVLISEDDGIALVNSASASDTFGNSVALLDLDGDGTGDIVTGDSGYDKVYFWDGPFSGSVYSNDAATYRGGDTAGYDLANLGDVDGDGYDDLGVAGDGVDAVVIGGASSNPMAAGAMVTYDGALDRTAGGDVDGDGVADVVLGAPSATSNAGAVYLDLDVGSGTITATSLITFDGGSTGDQVGYAVAVGDVDDDGISDIVFGVPLDNGGGTDAGAVYVVNGTGL